VGLEVLQQQLSSVSVPDVSGSGSVPVIGTINYQLSKINISSLALPSASFVIDPTAQGFQTSVSDASAQVVMNWHYSMQNWPHTSDSGSANIAISSTSVSMVTSVAGTPAGSLHLTAQSPSVNIGNFDITVHGGQAWLYNFLLGIFSGNLKGSIENALAGAIQQAVDQNANQALATVPLTAPITDGIVIDYALVGPLAYNSQYFGTGHDGTFVVAKNPVRAPGEPIVLPESVDLSRQFQFMISSYSANSAAFAFQEAGELEITIVNSDLPANSPLKLNTSDLSWLVLAPGLYNQFPNQAIQLVLASDPAPVTVFTPQLASVSVTGTMEVDVVFANGTIYEAFTLNGTVFLTANASLVPGPNISVDLVYLHTVFGLESTRVGNVSVSELNSLVSLLISSLVPKVNERLAPGFPIPAVDGVTLIDPDISIEEGYLLVATDISYKPSDPEQTRAKLRRPV
jgi:lipopolysaccharide-binding protein